MKRIISFILILGMMMAFSACDQTDTPDLTSTSGGTTNASGGDAVFDIAPPKPENPGNSLIDYDPAREVYICCHNYDYDIFPFIDSAPNLPFFIISKHPLNMDSLEVQIPIETEYHIFSAEYVGSAQSANLSEQVSSNLLFPDYLYERYWGVDWDQVQPDAGITLQNDQGEEVSLLSAYSQLTTDDLPEFYVYLIGVGFQNYHEESFSEMTVTVDGVAYYEQIGQIRLHEMDEQALSEGYPYTDAYLQSANGYRFVRDFYTDGYGEITLFSFTAEFDMELEQLVITAPGTEVLDIVICLIPVDGNAMDYYWDGSSSIYLSEGDQISIALHYRDPRQNSGVDYASKIWGTLCYSCETGQYSAIAHSLLWRYPNFCELYAIVFDGLDMEPYYRNFVQAQPSWVDDYR